MDYLGKIGATEFSRTLRPNCKKIAKVNFKGAEVAAGKLAGTAAKDVAKVAQKDWRDSMVKGAEWFEKYKGEIPSIIINGIGTAIAAPIVIAYNPLSKEDEKTKKYTSLRQPISAVITMATSLGVNYKSQKTIENMGKKGELAEYVHFDEPKFIKLNRENEYLKVLQKLNEKGKTGLLSAKVDSEVLKTFIDSETEGLSLKHITALHPGEQKDEISKLARKYAYPKGIAEEMERLNGTKGLIDKVVGNKENTTSLAKKIEGIVGQDNKIDSMLKTDGNISKLKERIENLISKNNIKANQGVLEELFGKRGTIEELVIKQKNLGQLKTITGVLLSLSTLLPAALILNWAYPRIVERFFPRLAKNSDTKVTEGKK